MLEVIDIHKLYENHILLKGVSFDVRAGETVCLLGSSGSGKSTLLRIITGLETSEKGKIVWNGEDMEGIPVHKRGFGLMFQDYALFPHRSVAENVAFGLRMQGLSSQEISRRTAEVLTQVNMSTFARRRVTDLSGGEQQRVALARALAPRPRLLMLDEPLGALDRALRSQLSDDLRRLLHTESIPVIYVTHDQEEAFTIADRLILLHEGCVEQNGTPEEVYSRPASIWAAHFLGMGNFLHGQVLQINPLIVATEHGHWLCSDVAKPGLQMGDSVTLLLRPNGAKLTPDNIPEGYNQLNGLVTDTVFYGEGYRIDVCAVDRSEYRFYFPNHLEVGKATQFFIGQRDVLCL